MNANNITKQALLFALLVILFFAITNDIHLRGKDDDLFFLTASHSDFFDFLLERYMTWSGRAIIELITIATIGNLTIVKLMIFASVLLVCVSSCAAFGEGKNLKYTVSFLTLFLLIEPNVLGNSVFWVVGYYNYLLPFSLLFYAMYVYINQRKSNCFSKILAILSITIACNNEQSSFLAIMTIPSMMIFDYCKNGKLPTKFSVLFLLFALMSFIFLFCAPGNYVRLDKEKLTWMANFDSMPILVKVGHGIDIFNHMIFNRNYVLIVYSLICLFYIFKQQINITNAVIILFLGSYVIIGLTENRELLRLPLQSIGDKYFHKDKITYGGWSDIKLYVSYWYALSVYSCIAISPLLTLRERVDGMRFIFISLLAFISVLMLSFSPTVYASGDRVLFLFNVLTIASMLGYIKFEKSVL
ncbi:TPA: hypothetical protein HNV55_07545 [Escherichia coli]|uniref:DUF6056 family protein n=1 Tax=Escherichia coli TaxID=562 RepID=UPI000DA503F6|nr:DUF6056 family protein [Escherichia coli]SQL30106.1 Uncharacterised protein [Escherichia coli]SQL76123.1 Uncharacterised protein [Escherichia coli]HAJ7427491.1 hypothetical protein [Escherichia coli]